MGACWMQRLPQGRLEGASGGLSGEAELHLPSVPPFPSTFTVCGSLSVSQQAESWVPQG